jgi:hypothetical protein
MAQTIITDVFNPEILEDAVRGVFSGKKAFMGSRMRSLGIAIINGTMPQGGPDAIGTSVTIPRFGVLGEFENNPDGDAITPKKLQQASDSATITRDSLAFSVSAWAQGNAAVDPAVGDPYEEAANQAAEAAERAIDKRLITAASASGVYEEDVYSASAPVYMDWDLVVEAMMKGWGDEAHDDVGAMLVHSMTHKDLLKLKDSTGRPLLLQSQTNGGPVDTFCGLPLIVSDRAPLTGSTMGSVTSSGTSPPVATITGTPLGAWKLMLDCVVGGAHATATVRFSVDGGKTWSDPITTAAATVAFELIDPAIDSTVGVNGKTGLSVAFAAGTFNADNLWESTINMQATSMLLKRNALAFWYSSNHLAIQTDKNVLSDVNIGAMHLYGAACRYRRRPGSSKNSGVVHVVHNVKGF